MLVADFDVASGATRLRLWGEVVDGGTLPSRCYLFLCLLCCRHCECGLLGSSYGGGGEGGEGGAETWKSAPPRPPKPKQRGYFPRFCHPAPEVGCFLCFLPEALGECQQNSMPRPSLVLGDGVAAVAGMVGCSYCCSCCLAECCICPEIVVGVSMTTTMCFPPAWENIPRCFPAVTTSRLLVSQAAAAMPALDQQVPSYLLAWHAYHNACLRIIFRPLELLVGCRSIPTKAPGERNLIRLRPPKDTHMDLCVCVYV